MSSFGMTWVKGVHRYATVVFLGAAILSHGCKSTSVEAEEPPTESVVEERSETAVDMEELTRFLASDELRGREEGTAESETARVRLIEEMERCDVEPAVNGSFEQPIATGDGVNIVGVLPGKGERYLLLSAHYDHVGECAEDGDAICNGADDNAAAVATVVHVACKLADEERDKGVVVALWDSEEPPTFLTDAMGSEYYASNPVVPLEKTDAVLVLDLVGGGLWPGYQGHFALGAELSKEVDTALESVSVPSGLEVLSVGLYAVEMTPFGHQPWSDYHPFRERGLPVVFLSNGQNKRYHQPDDEADSLDYQKMELQAVWLERLMLALDEVSPTFEGGRVTMDRDISSLQTALTSALAEDGMVETMGLTSASKRMLQNDLDQLKATDGLRDAEKAALIRRATQRLMCLAGPFHTELECALL